jgi:hypothetical protein
MQKNTQRLFMSLSLLKSVFKTFVALIVVISCLPIFILIFLHYFVVGFIETENKRNDDKTNARRTNEESIK